MAGFDKEGAKQLKHKLMNTRKWIGTAGETFESSIACLPLKDSRTLCRLRFPWYTVRAVYPRSITNDATAFSRAELVDFPKSKKGGYI
jgi:hypothetical protein